MEKRDHVLAVSGGVVPVEIESGLDGGLSHAVCTADGRRLFNRMELRAPGAPATVEEPTPRPKKNTATGSPSIRGVARVGTTLRASLSDLDGPDGLSGATFRCQWPADGTEIQGATGPTSTPDRDDADKTITARVNFTGDAGNEETSTSAATAVIAA